MNLKQTVSRVAFAVAALAVFPGLAAAQFITKVTVSPASAVIGTPVTFTVEGQGAPYQDCAVLLDYQDGQSDSRFPVTGWPVTFQHTYGQAMGTATIRVWATGGCQGQLSATITVVSEPGQIAGLTPPTSTFYRGVSGGEWVVNGTGSCESLTVDFGDGRPPWPVPTVHPGNPAGSRFPIKVYGITYYNTGRFTLKVTGGGTCQGQASMTVSVQEPPPPPPPPGPSPPPVPRPTITGVQGVVTPGGTIIVLGSGFGKISGSVAVLSSALALSLKDLEWNDNWVKGTVPDVTGVVDQNAVIRLQKPGLSGVPDPYPPSESNNYPVFFNAKRVSGLLLGGRIATVNCSPNGSYNLCYTTRPEGKFMIAQHGKPVGLVIYGEDKYSLRPLTNGWKYTGVLFMPINGNSELKGDQPTFEVHWNVHILAMEAAYAIAVFGEGPEGVSPY